MSATSVPTAHDLLASHIHLVQQAIAVVCRKNRLSTDDAEELASLVYVKLLDRDGAVLRTFRGESQLTTFLVVVVTRMLLDSRIARWGKWRPSVRARRLGAVAIAMEHCIYARGMRFQEAAEAIRTRFGPEHRDDELHALSSLLPERTRRRFVGVESLVNLASEDPRHAPSIDDVVVQRTRRQLARALSALAAEDRVLLSLRFTEGLRMSEIARRQGIDLKGIYRRFDRLMRCMRVDFERHGIAASDVQAWLSSC